MDELDVREDLMLSEILTTRHAALFPRVPGRRGIGIGFAGRGGHFLFSFLFFALFPFFPSFFLFFVFSGREGGRVMGVVFFLFSFFLLYPLRFYFPG